MGAVYPWKAVEEHRIPTVAAFDALREEALRRAWESDAIVAAAVYGSVARRDHGIRSDFDLLLVHRTHQRDEALRLLRALRKSAGDSSIVLSAYLLSVRQGRSGEHPFGPSYREDWRRLKASGNVIGIPALHVYAPIIPAAEEMVKALPLRFGRVRKLGFRLRHAFRSWRLDDIDTVLEHAQRRNNRPLHFYVACARWLMRWKDGALAHESKVDVTRAFSADPAFARLHVPFLRLAELDHAYDGLLDAAMRGDVDRQGYLLAVRQILQRAIASNDDMVRRAKEMIAGTPDQTNELSVAVA